MQKRQQTLATLVAVGMVFAATSNGADRPDQYGRTTEKNLAKASDIIGKDVRNAQDEDLGKVQDLIVSLEHGTVPYAVITHGGAVGIGRTKTAVPLSSLQCSPDGKKVILSATKDELKAVSKTPPEGWTYVRDTEWTKGIDGFYGEAPAFGRYERQRLESSTDRREFVRDRNLKDASVQMTIDDGVATLRGEANDENQRRDIEAKVKSMQGVKRVDNQLKLRHR